MAERQPATFFGDDMAARYDAQQAKFGPIVEALHFCLRVACAGLPADARVLCVGAGTGAELAVLAEAGPGWTFAVVEPAPAMMRLCREQAERRGFAGRCTFHEGYVETLPAPGPFGSGPFDAATSLLVSHFLTKRADRVRFFAAIAGRLRPGGLLVTADLAADTTSPEYPRLVDLWRAMYRRAGQEINTDFLGRDVALASTGEFAALLADAGFTGPTPFFQALLIQGWTATRAS